MKSIFYALKRQDSKQCQSVYMAILLKVKWVEKSGQPDPYQHISHIGGASGQLHWKHSHAQAIQSIEQDLFTYYVEKDARAVKLEVGLAPNGFKYLKVPADGEPPRLLLNLPEQPQVTHAHKRA